MTDNPPRSLAVVALAVAVFAVYWQVGDHAFIDFDDGAYVFENSRVQGGLTRPGIAWAFTTFHVANWHPLTWLSHMADVELFGPDAGWHHRVNVFFHCLNAILLFLVLADMTRAYWNSAIVAALFALHPLHVESVAWVAERKDLLSGLFFILCLWAYAQYARRPGPGRYTGVVLFFVLGLLSKPMVVTLPFVLLLLDFWPLRRAAIPGSAPDADHGGLPGARVSRLLLEKVPLLVLSAASCWVTMYAQARGGSLVPQESAGLGLRIANALVSYVSYVAATVWPTSLAFFYPFPFGGIEGWKAAGAAAILVSATGVSLFMGRRKPYIPVGWFWFLGTLVPVIGFVQVGMQAMADRYTYLPLTGLLVILAWGARDALGTARLGKGILGVAVAGTLLGLGAASWIQVGYWRSDFTLAERALRVTGGNSVALNLLGKAYERDGRMEKAVEAHRESIRVSPKYVFGWNSLGSALFATRRYSDALLCFREAVRLGPDYVPAWINAGTVLRILGRHSEALAAYREAIRRDPRSLLGWNNLGVALGDLGRYDEAGSVLGEALRIDPSFAEAWSNLGVVSRARGRDADATEAFREALRLQPDHVKALWGLGAIYSEQGRSEEAAAIHRRLEKIDPAEAERFLAEHIRPR